MSDIKCFYCGGSEGRRCTATSPTTSARYVTECMSCGRILEEHKCDVQELFVERAQDIPLCIVTPDFSDSNTHYRTPPLEDDPFESIGFITAFSTWSLELSPLFATATSSFCGYLAELERVLLDGTAGSSESSPPGGGSISLVDNLRAYFQIMEVCSLLGLDRDISDHAVRLFRDCSSAAYMRNRNIEALATAALVQASREAKEVRTLQEISVAATVPQKEIHRYLKILTDSLKLSQPINSNSISVYMPRFCSILELEKATQDLATHIGEVVMDKSFCTRRNPISISAAAIYLSCQLEDKRKTQTEICKATALTEVTLRKVYKELLEHLKDLLPADYTPVVPPEKAFLVIGPSFSRACANRGGIPSGLNLNVPSLSEQGTLGPEAISGGESLSALPSSGILGCGSTLPGCSNSIPLSCTKSAISVMEGGNGAKIPVLTPISKTASVVDRPCQRRKEEIRTSDKKCPLVGEFKFAPCKSSSFEHPFNLFNSFSPEVSPSSLPPRALHSVSLPDETMCPTGVDDKSMQDRLMHFALKGRQFTPCTMQDASVLTVCSAPAKDSHAVGDKHKVTSQEDLKRNDSQMLPVCQGMPSYSYGNFAFAATSAPYFTTASRLPEGTWDFKTSGVQADEFLQDQRVASLEPVCCQLPAGSGTPTSASSQPSLSSQNFLWQPAPPQAYFSSYGLGDASRRRTLNEVDGSGGLPVRYSPSGGGSEVSPMHSADLLPNLSMGFNNITNQGSISAIETASQKNESSRNSRAEHG